MLFLDMLQMLRDQITRHKLKISKMAKWFNDLHKLNLFSNYFFVASMGEKNIKKFKQYVHRAQYSSGKKGLLLL